MKKQNVILTGFMGTGKSTVGQILAQNLGYQFVDTDQIIEKKQGRSITEIFKEEGQSFFRKLEKEISQELTQRHNLVIATGGRLMLDQENASILQASGQTFCLTAHPHTLWKRLKNEKGKRPLLDHPQPEEKIQELLLQRTNSYAQFPQIDTSHRSPEQVALEIQFLFGKEVLPVNHPNGQYNVIIGSRILSQFHSLKGNGSPLAVITDSNVGPLYLQHFPPLLTQVTIPAGEQHKNLSTVQSIYEQLLDNGLDRQGTILALGGGVVGDVAGFVAATYLRGINFIQCPTSLLAMVDASVGGKTGVDLLQGKNLVGAFKQPQMVIIDLETLNTLPSEEFAAGMAEVIKAGLIDDQYLFAMLEKNIKFQEQNSKKLQTVISRAIDVKRKIVEQDPYEKGRRAVLNLGHTFAHAIEQVSNYSVRHGHAVAMGLVCAAHLSTQLGYCSDQLKHRIEAVLTKSSLPIRIPDYLPPQDLLQAMATDKKKAKGVVRFILIGDIGNVFIANNISESDVLTTLKSCR